MATDPPLDSTVLASDLAGSPLPDVVQSTYDYVPAALAGYAAGVGVVTMLFWGIAPPALMLPWMGAFVLMGVARFMLWQGFRRATLQTHADWSRWLLRSNIGTLVAGAFWGFTGWAFYVEGSGLQQTGLIVIVYTFSVVGIPVLSIQPRIYLAFAGLSFVPMVVRIASVGD